MSGLDLNRLNQYRDEILKAEIGALLFNLGKTHIGFWKEKKDKNGDRVIYFDIDATSFKNIYGFKLFSDYRNYYQKDDELNKSPFEYELEKFGLKDFIFNEKVKFPFNTYVKENRNKQETNELEWSEFFKGDASNKEIGLIQKIFFSGCENINSGIDKGSPNEQLKPPLWISNAFGSFKEEIKEHNNFDQRRLCFYSNLSSFLGQNGYFQSPNWKEIRNFVLKEIKNWYSHLLSDSRFPVNDVLLYDQAYMTASMFKAVLSQLVMDSSKLDNYQKNPSSIKWRILGIQYDKLGITEKSLKLASIQWYREIANRIDEEIKNLLEIEYPIGNEIYRDETGIYFIVGEDLGADENPNITKLKSELKEIEEQILEIFKKETEDEFYPAIFLTKASRGLMNLPYLLEKAKENFLKANWKTKDFTLELHHPKKGKAIGICQICQVRLIYESDKEKNNNPTICEVCDNRIHHKQVSKWIDNITGETIWIEEVKDKNNRVAYISLRFELEDWLNGNLLNSLVVRQFEESDNFNILKQNTTNLIKQDKKLDEGRIGNYIWGIPRSLKVRQIIESWLLERSIGQNWEEFIYKQLNDWDKIENKPQKQKIDFDKRKIHWQNLDNNDIEFLATLLLQFLLRKNPSPARLRRIWETTREFFEDIHENLDEILEIPDWRKKRLVWEVDLNKNNKLSESMELEAEGLLFWAEKINNKAKIYLISSIRDFLIKFGNNEIKKQVVESKDDLINKKIRNLKENIVKRKIVLKPYDSPNDKENNIEINTDAFSKIEEYKPFAKITDPSPRNYQIVIPAEYLEKFIDKVMEKYNKEFKYVYGKLPIHIGIVVSHYKKPAYVNLKALRRIRRDVKDMSKLYIQKDIREFCIYQKKKLSLASLEELANNTESYYSLYWNNPNEKDYSFYIKPDNEWKKWISTIDKFSQNSNIEIIPNTFDFEFMDTNTRRNDIFYDEIKDEIDDEIKGEGYKRVIPRKSNRPYEIEEYWEKFKAFKELVIDLNYQRSRLFKIVEFIYPKLQEIEELEIDYSYMFAPVVYRYLDLNDRDRRKIFRKVFNIDENLDAKEYIEKLREYLAKKENIYLFLDMFEFWHTMLKEV